MSARSAVWTACLAVILPLSGCKKTTSAADTSSDADAAPKAAANVAPVVVAPITPADRLAAHRKAMVTMAEAGQYAEVCNGTPWISRALCTWVAAKADGRSPERPDGEVFRAFFVKEHWKKVSGTILDPGDDGHYEVRAGGYRRHCILDTIDTKFSSKGNFNMWVQEQPETREVTVTSGDVQQWIVLEEAVLAKAFMDLAHSGGGIEAKAMAKDTMSTIAEYVPYSELKGELPPLPGSVVVAPSAASKTVPSELAAATPRPVQPTTALAVDPEVKRRARAGCLTKCVAACNDDASCERTCASSKCPAG
jgi:hypothetical protein